MSRYIKREDAVFAACKVLHQFGGCKMGPLCPDGGCSEVRDIIDTFPMIEIPEKHGRMIDVVRGKWRKIGKNSCIFVCSACDKTFPYITNFCPNCGADMRAEEGEW